MVIRFGLSLIITTGDSRLPHQKRMTTEILYAKLILHLSTSPSRLSIAEKRSGVCFSLLWYVCVYTASQMKKQYEKQINPAILVAKP